MKIMPTLYALSGFVVVVVFIFYFFPSIKMLKETLNMKQIIF